MVFYCPNCQKEYDVEPRETVTTLQNRLAYKATCPVCNQDMAEFNPGEKAKPSDLTPKTQSPTSETPPAQTPQPPAEVELAQTNPATAESVNQTTADQVLAQAGVGEGQMIETPKDENGAELTPVDISEEDFKEAQAALNAASNDLASTAVSLTSTEVKQEN